jgi:hypothetical protein
VLEGAKVGFGPLSPWRLYDYFLFSISLIVKLIMAKIPGDFKHIVSLFLLLLTIVFLGSEVFAQNIDKIQSNTTHLGKVKQKTLDSTGINKGYIIPVPVVITDQNLGYGGLLALGYVHSQNKSTRKNTPPTITGVTGGATTTSTWLAGIAHSHSFKNDQYRYLGLVAYANVNLDFYQVGSIDLNDQPVEINLKGWGTLQRFLFRAGNSDFFLGLQYGFFQLEASINGEDEDHPIIDEIRDAFDEKSIFSSLGLLGNYDSRENTISPESGWYAGYKLGYNATWLGATESFARLDLFAYSYVPLTKWLYSIYHFDYQSTSSGIPFYLKPYIGLRGVPIMRYQGNQAMILEAQLRGYFYKNWALIAFGGMGKAFDSYDEWSNNKLVVNYGTGFRYDFKKVFGLRAGADFAWAGDDFGWYITIGTSL